MAVARAIFHITIDMMTVIRDEQGGVVCACRSGWEAHLGTVLNRLALGRAGRSVNHVRVPALLSGFAFIVYFPLILGLGDGRYESATTLSQDVYLGRWLLLCGTMFAVSALLYAVRSRRADRSPGGAA